MRVRKLTAFEAGRAALPSWIPSVIKLTWLDRQVLFWTRN